MRVSVLLNARVQATAGLSTGSGPLGPIEGKTILARREFDRRDDDRDTWRARIGLGGPAESPDRYVARNFRSKVTADYEKRDSDLLDERSQRRGFRRIYSLGSRSARCRRSCLIFRLRG